MPESEIPAPSRTLPRLSPSGLTLSAKPKAGRGYSTTSLADAVPRSASATQFKSSGEPRPTDGVFRFWARLAGRVRRRAQWRNALDVPVEFVGDVYSLSCCRKEMIISYILARLSVDGGSPRPRMLYHLRHCNEIVAVGVENASRTDLVSHET